MGQQSVEDDIEEGRRVVQNVIVDGHNLVIRCACAPHLSELKDSQGRPTGAIYGTLKALGALRKRFPAARIYVTWDGSSKRRKQRFSEYKSNRPLGGAFPKVEGFDPIRFLQGILPLLGVWQATNPDEEADDIIASLVRVTLASEQNLIFSTDRDMLQLVTDKTSVLAPAAGNRNEMLFDAAAVEAAFGVPPSRMTQLRAFCGDSSDAIPGVPRVPKKVLKALVQSFGTVDGVYNSGLAGLTKAQYERLRSSEPQVRINLELMSVIDVPISVQEPDVDPDAVAVKLGEVDVNSASIVDTFFGHRGGAV